MLYLNRNIRTYFLCKWWFNGSGEHSLYKQGFLDSEYTDEYLFLVTIKNLDNHKLFVKTQTLNVSFDLQITMVNGSVCNVSTETNASAGCFIYGAKPKDMNSINIEEKPPNKKHFCFGLSFLHAYIRLMKCLLYIT